MHGLWTNDPTRRNRRMATLALHHAPTRSRHSLPSPPPVRQPREARATGGPGPEGSGSDADREDPVSPPPTSTPLLDGALRTQSSTRAPRTALPSAAWLREQPGPPDAARSPVRRIRRRFRARLGLRPTRTDHGRLRAVRGGGHRRRLLLPLRAQPPRPFSTRLAAVLDLLGDGRPRQPGLGLVRGGPGAARAQPQLRRPVLPVLRAPRHRGAARARRPAHDEGGLGLPGPGRLADHAARCSPSPGASRSPRRRSSTDRAWRTPRCRSRTRCSTSPW